MASVLLFAPPPVRRAHLPVKFWFLAKVSQSERRPILLKSRRAVAGSYFFVVLKSSHQAFSITTATAAETVPTVAPVSTALSRVR